MRTPTLSIAFGRLRAKAYARALDLSLALAILACASLLAGCERTQPSAQPPSPNEVLAEATGYYCGMLLADHEGPKGQVLLAGRESPLWFSSVRDTLAFLRLPEEPRDIAAVYVNDMARAQNWAQPEPGAWVDPRDAWFVIGSERAGGMGAPEAIPFSRESVAQAFVARHGGRIARLDEIPDDYVFGAVGAASATDATGATPGH